MKKLQEGLFIIVTALLITYLLILITNQLKLSGFSSEWFSMLSSVATSFAAVANFILLVLTFLYLLATRNMVDESRKQRIAQEDPVVSVRIIPDKNNAGMLNICLRNTGGGPAYNVSVHFEPDLPYHDCTINNLRVFNNMPVIDKSEDIEFLFASAHIYFMSENPKKTTAHIKYYRKPLCNIKKDNDFIERVIDIDLEERKDQLYINQNGINDLVKEVEELKQGILMLLSEKVSEDDKK